MRKFLTAIACAVVLTINAARADDVCETVNSLIEKLPDAYLAHKMLTAAELKRGADGIVTGMPDEIKEAAAFALKDGRLLLYVWQADGNCGHAVLPSHLAHQFLQAIVGRDA